MNESYTITTMVIENMTASYVKSGDLPVLATPVMIGLMEQAASYCLKTQLPEGMTSVGTEVEVRHLSATPLGATVKVQAVLTELSERRASFSLKAYDDAGLIGEGSHTRAIVNAERFMEKAENKLKSE